MQLHPSSFVETGNCTTCDGPRNIRIQPSRSSDLNDQAVPQNYATEWSIDLPFNNLLSYTKSIEDQWRQLTKGQRDVISNSLTLFVTKNPDSITGLNTMLSNNEQDKKSLINALESKQQIEKFNQTDIYAYIDSMPEKRIPEVFDNITLKYDPICNKWLRVNKYYHVDDVKIFILVVLFIIVLLIGVGIGYSSVTQ